MREQSISRPQNKASAAPHPPSSSVILLSVELGIFRRELGADLFQMRLYVGVFEGDADPRRLYRVFNIPVQSRYGLVPVKTKPRMFPTQTYRK